LVSTESAFQRLSEFIERQLPTLNAPGIAIGITHRERTFHADVFGLANKETGQAVTPETLFQIGSKFVFQYQGIYPPRQYCSTISLNGVSLTNLNQAIAGILVSQVV
jgi:hypothetical protein